MTTPRLPTEPLPLPPDRRGPAGKTRSTPVAVALALAIAGCSGPGAAQSPGGSIILTTVAAGLEAPTHITHAGDGSGRLFVVEQAGRIRILAGGALLPAPFLDIRSRVSCCGEQGLLSVAFPPGFATKRYFYVNYTDTTGDTVVARFRVTGDPDVADPGSAEVVLAVDQPFGNHNGGQLAFGPDGFLYIGMGDGGSGGDPFNNGQSPMALLGKLLRIDVESAARPYAVPADNPFRGNPSFRPEIWALGLRNPWRFSFDRLTGELWTADVGQNTWEEVNVQPGGSPGGENYGWRFMEGSHCFDPIPCSTTGLLLPVAEYDHSQGCSVTGGHVVRGPGPAALEGAYVYGDYCSGRVWAVRRQGGGWVNEDVLDTPYTISTFGEDEAGNLYLANHGGGEVYRFDVEPCTLDCAATVPAAAGRGALARFVATATSNGCPGIATVDWDFGDGSEHAATATSDHVYASRGVFTWRLTVAIGGTTCTRSDTIVVGATPRPTLTSP